MNSEYLMRGKSGQGMRTNAQKIAKDSKIMGNTYIVTGCNSGLGYETALALAACEANVIITCRSQSKADDTAEKIKEACKGQGMPDAKVFPLVLELEDLNSVRAMVKEFNSKFDGLDALINNAGVMALPTRELTKQGIEKQMGVNHIAHFLLCELLMPKLKSSQGRVVCVGSMAYRMVDDSFWKNPKLESEKQEGWKAYGNAKMANIMHGKALDNRQFESGVTGQSLHPGGIHTGLQTHVEFSKMLMWAIFQPFMFKSTSQGAATSVQCAVSPKALQDHGCYFEDCNVKLNSKEDLRTNQEALKTFWDHSTELSKL